MEKDGLVQSASAARFNWVRLIVLPGSVLVVRPPSPNADSPPFVPSTRRVILTAVPGNVKSLPSEGPVKAQCRVAQHGVAPGHILGIPSLQGRQPGIAQPFFLSQCCVEGYCER
jgi:hypothetical protein